MRRTIPLLVVAVAAVLVPAPARADSPFTDVVAIATKTGFRAAVAWQAGTIVSGVVHYGTAPDALDLSARPVLGVPDTAQMVYIDGLEPGTTYHYAVEDQLSGQRSPVSSFVAANAYNNWDGATYTLNLVVQLDLPGLPDSVQRDLGLRDIAEGVNVFAERVYDALDGFARIGTVIVTDTITDYPTNVPFATTAPGCTIRAGNLADVLIQTTVPLDSHTFAGFAIAQQCTQISVGRLGWLGATWLPDGLQLGYVFAHEFMHYAFNAPDLYSTTGGGSPNCTNINWDGSLMHNSGGYRVGRWWNTELDRNPTLTPCEMGTAPYSWDRLRSRYTNVPERAAGPIEHVIDRAPKGNEDGGALDIWILDREPLSSTLTRYVPAA